MKDRATILTDDLFYMSDVILSTDNIYERDRWGSVLGMEISGLRINDYALIFSHIGVDESEDSKEDEFEVSEGSMLELEECTNLENLFVRAKYHHDCYYDGFPVQYTIEDPSDLKNQSAIVGKRLDELYKPQKNFIPTPPSEILPIITKKNTFESGTEWAWFNKTLYLTQSIKIRGLYNSRDEFDDSLANIFESIKFNVKKVSLIGYNADLSLIENIKKTTFLNQVRNIEQSIYSKSQELKSLKVKVSDLEKSIAALNNELDLLKSKKRNQ